MSKDDIKQILTALEPILGKQKTLRYWKLWLSEDRTGRESLQRDLELLLESSSRQGYSHDRILLNPPHLPGLKGELPIGKAHYNGKDHGTFGIESSELLRHTTIFGQSGSGKTNLGYILLLQLLDKKIPFLVLDWKRNYRDLKSFTAGQHVEVYTVGKSTRPFKFNPLIPPTGTPPEVWLKKLIEIIGKAYYVGEGVMSILHRGIDAVYRRAGVYGSEPISHWPTLRDVKDWIEWYVQKASTKELKAQWIASTMRTLQSLCFGDMDDILNDDLDAIPIEELLNKPVVLELDGLTDNDKTLIIDSILLWIHHYRLQEPEREKLKHIILIEEAHHVLRKKLTTEQEGIMDVIIREIRELGEGLIMISQSPSNFSQNAISNSATSFVFALKERFDVRTAFNFLRLTDDQEDYLYNLPVGYCIAKAQSASSHPFLLNLPHIKYRKGSVTNEMLQVQPQAETEGWASTLRQCEHANQALQRAVESDLFQTYSAYSGPDEPVQAEQGFLQLLPQTDREDKINMLVDIATNPMSGVNQRYKRQGLSTRHGNETKKALLEEGLVRANEVKTPEGHMIVLELTDGGRRALEELRPDVKIPKRGNGVEHRYWKNRVGKALEEQGLNVEYEKKINGGRADIVATNGGMHVVEIETGKSNLNKKRDSVKDLTVIGTNPKARRKLAKT